MERLRRRSLGLTLVLGLAMAAAACGEREDAGPQSSPSSSNTQQATPTPPATPACTAVWASGKVFPDDYAGCLENGKKVSDEPIVCETGQLVYRHKDRFYATNGAEVRKTAGPLRDDPQYQKMYEACTA